MAQDPSLTLQLNALKREHSQRLFQGVQTRLTSLWRDLNCEQNIADLNKAIEYLEGVDERTDKDSESLATFFRTLANVYSQAEQVDSTLLQDCHQKELYYLLQIENKTTEDYLLIANSCWHLKNRIQLGSLEHDFLAILETLYKGKSCWSPFIVMTQLLQCVLSAPLIMLHYLLIQATRTLIYECHRESFPSQSLNKYAQHPLIKTQLPILCRLLTEAPVLSALHSIAEADITTRKKAPPRLRSFSSLFPEVKIPVVTISRPAASIASSVIPQQSPG